MITLQGKNVYVLGLGELAYPVIKFLVREGAKVKAFDRVLEELREGLIAPLKGTVCEFCWDKLDREGLEGADLVILTAGVTDHYRSAIAGAEDRKIPVIGMQELATRFCTVPIIGVTGTNGKTSTITLLKAFLEKGGRRVAIIGGSFQIYGDYLLEKKKVDYLIVEAGSFELELSSEFHPWISVFTNVGPAHQGRHRSFEEYLKAKAKIFANQKKGDFFIYRGNSKPIQHLLKTINSDVIQLPFSTVAGSLPGAFLEKKKIVCASTDGKKEGYETEGFRLKGKHNLENLMAAILVARLCGVEPDKIRETIPKVTMIPHRLEEVAKINGVTFYNDSKATNVTATTWALNSFKGKQVILILGGRWYPQWNDKDLIPYIQDKAKMVVIFGSERQQFYKLLEKAAPCFLVESVGDAVQFSLKKSVSGDSVLFSPAVPPEIMVHINYLERGTDFKQRVKGLEEDLVKKRIRSSSKVPV